MGPRGARGKMRDYALRLSEDRVEAGASLALGRLNRVLYVQAGEIVVRAGAGRSAVAAGAAGHDAGECVVEAGLAGAVLLRYELLGQRQPRGGKVLLEHAITLDPSEQYLMRCDRVEFQPGGIAWLHRHRGGGIRCLIAGELEVRVGDAPVRVMKPGDAWFESGVEPVYAAASPTLPTSFIRVSILPRSIRGQSSIIYVDPADAGRGKPRAYAVYVDEPIEIG